jgi:hypothetical protein
MLGRAGPGSPDRMDHDFLSPWVGDIGEWHPSLREYAEWRNMLLGGTWALNWILHPYQVRNHG